MPLHGGHEQVQVEKKNIANFYKKVRTFFRETSGKDVAGFSWEMGLLLGQKLGQFLKINHVLADSPAILALKI